MPKKKKIVEAPTNWQLASLQKWAAAERVGIISMARILNGLVGSYCDQTMG